MSEFKVGDRVITKWDDELKARSLDRDTVPEGEHVIIEISGGDARLDEPDGYWYPLKFMTKVKDAPAGKDDGGPAFPRAEVKDTAMGFQVITGHHPGMSLRDYLIAHAPAEPQEWFQPRDRDGDASCAIFAGDEEYIKQRYVQWPAAWADEMLKARKK